MCFSANVLGLAGYVRYIRAKPVFDLLFFSQKRIYPLSTNKCSDSFTSLQLSIINCTMSCENTKKIGSSSLDMIFLLSLFNFLVLASSFELKLL